MLARPALFTVCTLATLEACQLTVFTSHRNLDAEASKSFSTLLDASDDVGLTVEGINGGVTIVGDPVPTDVHVSAVITVRSDSYGDAEGYLDRVSVEVANVGDEVRIWTDQPTNTAGREVIVDYQLRIPGYLAVTVDNVNGEVEIRSLDASVAVESVNGSIVVSDVVGDLDATLANGDIDAELTLLAGGHADLSTVNGNMALRVPVSTSAMLDADVANGTVSVLGLTIKDATTTARSVHGRLGAGDGLIELDVTNGTITVRAQ